MITKELRSFARSRVFSTLKERADSAEFDRSLWEDLAGLGLPGMVVEKEFGGSGLGETEFIEALGILAGEGMDLGLTLSLLDHVMLCIYPIRVFADRGIKEKYLPPLCSGEIIGAAAVSEPEAGGNPTRFRTVAERRDGTFVISGIKGPVTNAPVADLFVVVASTDPSRGKDGLTAFLLEKGEGVEVERVALDFLPTSPHGKLVLKEAVVSAGNMLGEEGKGHDSVSRSMFIWERAAAVSIILAVMERWHHLVVSGLHPADLDPDGRVTLAQRKVELTAYRFLSRRLLELTFSGDGGGRERMELLLFFGKALPAWLESMQRMVEKEKKFPLDEVSLRVMNDLRLIEVGRSLLDWQYQRILI